MKAFLIRISVGVIVLAALVYFLACTSPTPSNNSNQNQPIAPKNVANDNASSKDELKPCEYGSEPGSHAQHIKNEIKDKMGPSLKKLLKGPDNPDGTFTVEIEKASNGTYFIARVKGKVSGDDNLKELSNILNDFQSKQECLRVVYFIPEQAAPGALGDPGFEWSSCEYPMRVCPNGECCMTVEANTNTNVNASPPPNTNGNSNRGGNTNN